MINNAQMLNAAVQKFHHCLKTRNYTEALPYLELDLLELFKAGSGNIPGKKNSEAAASASSSTSTSTAQPVSSTSGGTLQSLFGGVGKSNASAAGGQASSSSRKHPPSGPQGADAAFEVRQVLLYFYYGSMILCVLERYEESLLFLEHALCLPAVRPSAIVLECMKKYVLVSLILGQGKIELPAYKSSVIPRIIMPMAPLYMKLAQLYQTKLEKKEDVAGAVQHYLDQYRGEFAKDQHVGLMKRVVIACKENAIKRLGKVFVSLELGLVSQLAFIKSDAETLEITRRLCERGELNVSIDEATQTFHFIDIPVAAENVEQGLQELELLLSDVAVLKKEIADFSEAVQLSPAYIQKTAKMARAGEGGLFPEDEGFHAALAGNSSGPPSSPPHTSN